MRRYGAAAVVCLITLWAWQSGAWDRGGFAITQPSIAASNGFNKLVFYEDWSSVSSIDLNNTKNSGYRWYLNGYYPVQSGWWLSQFNTFTATPPQYLRVADNTLFLQPLAWANPSTPPSNNFGNYIQTCAWNGTTIVGNAFGGSTGGFYIDAMMCFDGSVSFDFRQPHHYQFLWVTRAKNGGTGLMEWFVDGVAVGQITYSSSGLSNPDLSPSGSNGELSVADQQHFCLFIDPGLNPNQGAHVGTVQIWQ
jgi:hypothetical protein